MSDTPPRPRIVVAMDPGAPSDLPIDIVEQLWLDPTPELVGLFVEDARLLAHAASGIAREVVFAGGARLLESSALARHLRARATEVRLRFEARARALGLEHAFEVRRGDVVGQVLESAAGAAALVVGVGAAAAARAWWSEALVRLAEAPLPALLFAREGWSTGHGIVALVERADATASALHAGIALAARSRSPLSVLVAATDTAERAALAAFATRLAGGAGVELRGLLPSALTAGSITGIAEGARLLVLAGHHVPRGPQLMTTLIANLRVPVLLVAPARPAASTPADT